MWFNKHKHVWLYYGCTTLSALKELAEEEKKTNEQVIPQSAQDSM